MIHQYTQKSENPVKTEFTGFFIGCGGRTCAAFASQSLPYSAYRKASHTIAKNSPRLFSLRDVPNGSSPLLQVNKKD